MKKIFALFVAMCCLLTGCTSATKDEETNSVEEPPVEHITIDYVNRYGIHNFTVPEFDVAEKIEFVSETEKQGWRKPLTQVLATLHAYDYNVEYPPNDVNPNGYTAFHQGSSGIGLIDLNGDGVPEIAEWIEDGGTALNSSIMLYALEGTQLGEIMTGWCGDVVATQEDDHVVFGLADGGTMYGNYSIFVDKQTGEPAIFGQFNFGNMITTTEHYFSEIVFDEDSGSFYQVKPYYWFRVIENKYGNAHNVRVHVAIDEGFYFKKDYKTYVSVDEVNAYFADLKENYYRVANSQMIIIEWSAIDGYGTLSQEDLAEKMADMLLSSDQKFIREPEDCK